MANRKALLLGVLIGGTVGSVSTLLTTSMSGKELRKKIKRNNIIIGNHYSSIKANGLNLVNDLKKATKYSTQELGLLADEIKTSILKWEESTKNSRDRIQKELSEIEDSLKSLEKAVKQK
ncbi:YtxH domain-containing protein [Litchfieldia salsa]|uniref:Gas vesicle protein n=1 Tax=Litchfieldia salsa TaxID=930152 RepID=A0A1H0UWC4_9BACI|nr:YtxH domain-containing protein [Litchfieldia salsa]SDP70228.1 Gas vesicle protein [Litchfieldia salsa]